jgi:hypothetical protein
MLKEREPLLFASGLVVVGAAWLLNSFEVIPGVEWVWTLPLGVMGIIALAWGINKVTVVVGPFLIVASVLSILRQTDRLRGDHEAPILMIVLGVLMLVSYFSRLPVPPWVNQQRSAK